MATLERPSSFDGDCAHCRWPHHPTDGPTCKNCNQPWAATVPPEPPTLSDEPRAGRRRNTALPPIGDVSPHLCYECGGAHPLVVREKRMARWGQDPEVEIEDEWYRCPKCGDGYYTSEQAQAHERALWLATIAALRAEVTATQTRLASLKRYGLANGMQRFTDGQWVLYDDVIRAARSASGEDASR